MWFSCRRLQSSDLMPPVDTGCYSNSVGCDNLSCLRSRLSLTFFRIFIFLASDIWVSDKHSAHACRWGTWSSPVDCLRPEISCPEISRRLACSHPLVFDHGNDEGILLSRHKSTARRHQLHSDEEERQAGLHGVRQNANINISRHLPAIIPSHLLLLVYKPATFLPFEVSPS